jgi:O-antigen/teichoic acid export membrane protein
VLASNLCVLADQTAMTYVVGRVQGVSAIGLYQVGQQVAMLPITELAAPMQAPFYSGFSKIYHDLKELRRQFLAAFELQWIVLLPMTAGIALTAYEVTGIFLGTRWLELVPLMPLIAFFGLADCFATNTLNIFRVLDRQARMVISWFILVGIRLLALIYATLEHGLLGATWAMLLTALLYMVVWQHQANGLLGLGSADMVRALWRGSLACLLMAAAVLAVPGDIGTWLGIPTWPMIVALLLKTLVGAVVYVGVLLLCWRLAGRPDGSGEAYVIRWGGEILGRLRWPGGRAAALPQGRPGP